MLTITPKTAFIASVAGLAIGTIATIARLFLTQGFIDDKWLFLAFLLMFYLPIAVIAVAPSWYLFQRIVRAKSGFAKWTLAIAAMLLPTAALATVFVDGKINEMTAAVACLFLPTIVAVVLLAVGGSNARRPMTDRFQIGG